MGFTDWIKPKPPEPKPHAWKIDLDLVIKGSILVTEVPTGPPVATHAVFTGIIKNENTGATVGEVKEGQTMIPLQEDLEVWGEISPGTSPEGNPYTWPDGFTNCVWSVDDPTIALVDNIDPKDGHSARVATPKPGPLGQTLLHITFPGTNWPEIIESITVSAKGSPAASVTFSDPMPEKTGQSASKKK